MSYMMAGIIHIETLDAMMKIGPFILDEPVSDEIIKNKIHEVLLEHNLDNISIGYVEDVVFIGTTGDEDVIYSPNIVDVWPRDFGKDRFTMIEKKEGDKQ